MNHRKTTPARGFSLIEMLVGVLIISFGLLGLITLQARSLQASVTTEDAQRAALLANEMAAMMLNANRLDVATGDWAKRAADPASGGMNGGKATVAINNNTARITVTWKPTGNASDSYQYVTDVMLPQ